MKLTNMFFTLILVVTFCFISCNKEEVPVQQNHFEKKEVTNIQLPSFKGMNFDIPDVPPYVEENNETANSRGVIQVAPGTNQLQSIIDNASNNSTIRLLAGTHTEDVTLVVNHKIKLKGDDGAVLSLGGVIGLMVDDANHCSISDLEIVNGGGSLIALAVVNSDHMSIKGNEMSGFSVSVVLEQANHAKVHNNTIEGTNDFVNDLGITNVNGDHVSLKDNNISNCAFGIWACDNDGKAINNNTPNNLIGIILCNVPAGSFPIGDGNGGSENPCTDWVVTNNTSNDNFWGYLVIDGSNNNTLSNNSADNNVMVDMELAAVTNNLFGFETPISEDNTVNVGGEDIDIIDCGLNNVVNGGTAASGPCSD